MRFLTPLKGILNLGTALLLRVFILDDYIKLNIEKVNYNISTLKSGREFTSPFRKNEILELKKLSFSSSEMSSAVMCLAIVLGEFTLLCKLPTASRNNDVPSVLFLY
jgi:hypothetical protein